MKKDERHIAKKDSWYRVGWVMKKPDMPMTTTVITFTHEKCTLKPKQDAEDNHEV